MDNFAQFVQWGFYGMISGCILYAVKILSDLEKSVESLNLKVGVIIEKTSQHEKQIDMHDNRLRRLEFKEEK